MWYRIRGNCSRHLAIMLFGQTSTPIYKWLKFGRKVLLYALSRDYKAEITLPTDEETEFFCHAIETKYESLPNFWSAYDGLKLLIQEPTVDQKQNQLYNGWKHTHNINCVFVFSPDGKIRLALLNAPGTFHDSTMADYGIYEGMERVFNRTGAKVVVDSAFNIGRRNFLLKSSQQDPMDDEGLRVNRAATSVRQLSEWGMRMIGSSFPCLKDPLLYEKNDRMVILHLMVHLYNFQAS